MRGVAEVASAKRKTWRTKQSTHYAGQPSVKLVFDILVVGSSISISAELSTDGSHSFLNSGVTKIDFHESSGIESSGARVTSS